MRRGSGKIEKKYAKALLELCAPEECETRAAALRTWQELLQDLPELRSGLENPALPLNERLAISAEVCELAAPGDTLVKNFVAEIIANSRLDSLAGISSAFQAAVEESRGEMSLQVVSAFPLDDEERDTLKREMEQTLQKKLSIAWSVDQRIIGGLIVRGGDTVLDNSLRGMAERLRRELMA